jgi:hypothetical protein
MTEMRIVGMSPEAWAALPTEMKREQRGGMHERLNPETGERVALMLLSRQPGEQPAGAWRSRVDKRPK